MVEDKRKDGSHRDGRAALLGVELLWAMFMGGALPDDWAAAAQRQRPAWGVT